MRATTAGLLELITLCRRRSAASSLVQIALCKSLKSDTFGLEKLRDKKLCKLQH